MDTSRTHEERHAPSSGPVVGEELPPDPATAPGHAVSDGGSAPDVTNGGGAGPPVPVAPPADGARRRRTAFLVVAAAVLAGLVGAFIGHGIQSPADRAASSAAPVPSLITVPVERRALTSELVLSGTVDFNQPVTVQLAGGVGIDPGEAAVVTDVRAVGDTIQEGDVILEVTGRPVMALQGDLPMYRRLVIGSEGADVAQLEQALVRLGHRPGTVDTVFDVDTATAVMAMYADAGHSAEGPSVEERDALTAAREAVRQAEENLVAAQEALADAEAPMAQSERLQLERSLVTARAAVPAAEAAAAETRRAGDQEVLTAQAGRDTAVVARDTAANARDRAVAGAIDPDTGAPYTAERVGQLQLDAAQAQEALVAADGALVAAQTQRDTANDGATAALADANFNLQLTEVQYAEATAGEDTTALDDSVADAGDALDDATTNLSALEAATGVRISPGEIVFVPVLPSSLTEVWVGLGTAVQGPIGTLATSSTLVSARVSRVDSALVAVGAPVTIDIRGSGIETTGTVLSVGAPPTQVDPNVDGGFGTPDGGGESGRLVVTVAPDDPDLASQYVFWDARVVVSVAATDGEVLVVPVAALTVGPDEVSQVEVERTAATDDEPAITEIVEVEVGLTAGGLAEVRPTVDGALVEGDRVVVGVETNERLNEDETDGPEQPGSSGDDGDDDSDDDGGEDGDSGDSDDGGEDDGAVVSPLSALLGYDTDPVEQRRLQLEVEEAVADCMRDEGFDYEPVDYSSQMNPEDELQWTDPQRFGEQYGYGIMRSYELYEIGDGYQGPEFVDPNQDYVNSLSPDEQNAYYAALHGDAIEEPAVGGDATVATVVAAPMTGCYNVASAEVFGQSPGDDPEIQEALGSYYEDMENDPRLQDAYSVWATCVAPALEEAGLTEPAEDPNAMYGFVNRAKYEAQGLEVVPVSSQAEIDEYFNSGEDVYTAEMDENGVGTVYLGQPIELSGQEIDRLTQFEVDLWTADIQCQEEAQLVEVRQQLERDVVDQLLDRFPQLAG